VNNLAYIFQFPNEAAANYDPVVGQGQYPFIGMIVYDTSQGGVSYLPGYWPMIVLPKPINVAFQNHPAIQLIMAISDDGPARTVIYSAFAPKNLSALSIINTVGVFATPGLSLQGG
jgi:hypothetical protein